jgi:hypothetical protein
MLVEGVFLLRSNTVYAQQTASWQQELASMAV